jgi:hypothetical protein
MPAEGFGLPKPRPSLGHPGQVLRGKARQPGRVLRQLSEGAGDLRLRPRDDCRPSAASRWRGGELAGVLNSAHGLDLAQFPHPGRHPSWAGLPTTGEPLDLAGRLLGPCFLKPPLPAIVHGRERSGFAILRYGACAAPAMELTAFFAGHGPLLAKAVTMTHAGAAALFVFAMRAGLCHRRNLSMQMAKSIVRFAARVNPKS